MARCPLRPARPPAVAGLRLATAALLVFGLAACAPLPTYVNERNGSAELLAARRILLAPPELRVFEVSAGGVPEPVKAWSDQALPGVIRSLKQELARSPGTQFIEPDGLDAADRATLDLHLAMFRRVADQIAAVRDSHDPIWKERAGELEFLLGSGMQPLAERTGADAVLFVDGIDFISSTGRRIVFVLSTILAGGIPVLPLGTAYMQAGLVDLRSGEVLWFGRDYRHARGDLREAETAGALTAGVFRHYPGLTAVPVVPAGQ